MPPYCKSRDESGVAESHIHCPWYAPCPLAVLTQLLIGRPVVERRLHVDGCRGRQPQLIPVRAGLAEVSSSRTEVLEMVEDLSGQERTRRIAVVVERLRPSVPSRAPDGCVGVQRDVVARPIGVRVVDTVEPRCLGSDTYLVATCQESRRGLKRHPFRGPSGERCLVVAIAADVASLGRR